MEGGGGRVRHVLVAAQGTRGGVPAGSSVGGEKRTAGFSPPGEEPPLIGISWISKSCSTSGCESASTSGARSVALRKRYFQKRAFQSAAPSLLP